MASCLWDELSMERNVYGAKCPWDELSMGQVVSGVSCSCGLLSIRRIVMKRDFMSQVVMERRAELSGNQYLIHLEQTYYTTKFEFLRCYSP